MRRAAILVIGLLAALIMMPTAADARRGFPIGMFNTLTSPMKFIARGAIGRRVAHRSRHHRRVALARHPKPVLARSSMRRGAETAALGVPAGQIAVAGTAAQAAGADRRQDAALLRTEPSGWAGPLYWPRASDDLFEYAFRPSVGGDRFWSRGARDLADAIFMRDADRQAGWTAMCGGERPASAWIDAIAQAVQPTDAQRRALDELDAALGEAGSAIKAACPAADMTATPPQRLATMTDRLWAMRQAAIIMRPPLEKFANTLDEQQKARFDEISSAGDRRKTMAEAPATPAGPARACADPAAAMIAWPNEQIERRVRPAPAQRELLQTLQMTTQGMGQLLMASCPKEPPTTPLARLDAAEKRLNAMLYAARVVGPQLHGFYHSLTDQQKTGFNALGREPRMSSPGMPTMAR